MPLTIRLTDLSTPQAWILADATPFNDGVMTSLQAAQLAALVAGGGGGGGGSLPPQGGNAGKYLQTNGSSASWQNIVLPVFTDATRPVAPSVGTMILDSSEGNAVMTWKGPGWVMGDGRSSLLDQTLATQSAKLWAYWEMNDIASPAVDASGNNHRGIYQNGDVAFQQPSIVRRTVKASVTGKNFGGQVVAIDAFPFSSTLFSVAFFIAPYDFNGLDYLVFQAPDWSFTIVRADGSATIDLAGTVAPAGTFKIDSYYHVVIIWDGTNFSLVVNGMILAPVLAVVPPSADGVYTLNFAPGAPFGVPGAFVQDFAIWTTALTASEARNVFDAGGTP